MVDENNFTETLNGISVIGLTTYAEGGKDKNTISEKPPDEKHHGQKPHRTKAPSFCEKRMLCYTG